MKRYGIFPAILLAIVILASCRGSNSDSKKADTGAGKAKGDTSIVSKGGANTPNDSISGDPSAKGAADPNAKLPKK
jgi:hypothetical protein